jgi:mannitol-1-/sugar-/sorbitol-6-/2-deoxyglucose-6-phosphatase
LIQLIDFEAVIFDMDGVIIDSEPLWKIAMEEVFSGLGSRLKKEDFQKTVGLRIDEVIHYWNIKEHWGISDESEVEEAIIIKMENLIADKPAALEGVIDTLNYLKLRNIPVGLATSSSSRLIKVVLDKLEIKHLFNFVHSAEMEQYGKPHPAVYLTVAKKLAVLPEKCLVIEDSLNGIISAKAAKMTAVCIPEKTHHIEPKLILADYQFESMTDFLKIIQP